MIRIDADGKHAVAASDLMFPNGAVITDDGAMLIVGESFGGRYTAFRIGERGELGQRRTWATLSSEPDVSSFEALLGSLDVIVDGCCLDAEGAIWAADPKNARAIRIREGTRSSTKCAWPTARTSSPACSAGRMDAPCCCAWRPVWSATTE